MMKIKKTIGDCTSCGDSEDVRKDCTIHLDTSCIFYRWKSTDDIALNCLGLTSGTDLSTILEEIDKKLCEFSGFNLSGYDLGCLTEAHDIFSFQQFAEAVSKEICTLKEGEFSYKLDTLNTNINYINKPTLNDTCIGYVKGDSIQNVLQKLLDKVCEIDSKKSVVVSSPDIETVPSSTVDLTACGEKNHTLKAEVKISGAQGNKLKALDSGLFVPSLTDADIGLLLDRINSVPALKEKLCNICSFNQGVGGSSNARVCKCTLKIESVARYNINKYSVIINTVDLDVAPFYWEVRNNLNIIVASGNTTAEANYLETFDMPLNAAEGSYTIRFTSQVCDCTDIKTFNHLASQAPPLSPSVISAVQSCTEDSNSIIVKSQSGSNPEVTTIIRNSNNVVIHTRTNSESLNEYEITVNGTYIITLYDADNGSVSSLPYIVNVTCVGTVDPPEEICVTYNVINFTDDPITIFYTDCGNNETSAIINAEDNAILCMIRNSFNENENLTFTEIAEDCEAVCSFEILSSTVECI